MSLALEANSGYGHHDDNVNDFPFPLFETVEVSGIQFHRHGALDDRFRDLLRRPQVRLAALYRVAKQTWGLDSTILKIIHGALITSLILYGLIFVGFCFPDDLANRMDTQISNPAARRITGLPLSTGIESLRCLAGTQSFRNIHIQHCAEFVFAAFVAGGGQLQSRAQNESCAIFHASDLQASPYSFQVNLEASMNWDSSEVPLRTLSNTEWMAVGRAIPFDPSTVSAAPSTFFAHANEIEKTETQKTSYLYIH